MEEIEIFLDEARSQMEKTIEHVIKELSKVRAGKAMPSMLDSVMVEYYGNPTPLNQMSTVNSLDARTLVVKPWEKNLIGEVEKAILHSDLGLNPNNDGEQIIINIPQLTEERRIELVKHAKHEGEQGKISIRNIRHEILHHIKDLKNEGVSEDAIRNGEELVQDLTNEFTGKIEDMVSKKEEEILTV